MRVDFAASLQDAKVILGWLTPGCPFAALRVHPGLTSCRPYGTPLGLLRSGGRRLGTKWGSWSENMDLGYPAPGEVRHRDHKTVDLVGWHRVYMNRERFARHAPQIAFLD